MLLSFRVANHGSLREPQELNLAPVYADERPALTVAAIFGANASGKSTVLDAMRFFAGAVKESQAHWLPDAPIKRRPFLLDHESRAEPSRYGVDVLIDGVRYVYGFAVTDTAFSEEWLYAYPKGRRRVLFERDGMKLDYGASLTGNRVQIEQTLRPNSLYLAAAAQAAHPQLTAVWRRLVDWPVVDDRMRQSMAQRGAWAAGTFEAFERVGTPVGEALLAVADFGVRGVRQGDETGNAAVRRWLASQEAAAEDGGEVTEALRKASMRSLEFVHKVGDEEFVLPATAESSGTRTWLHLATVAVVAIATGSPLWIDEIDLSLHPLLTARLLKIFQDPAVNRLGAQLVFTTHSAALLGTMLGEDVLRRDQIWFTEKDPATAVSTLYPLSDFKPRKGENFERRYLAGSYGAVPLLPEAGFEESIKAILEAAKRAEDLSA